MEKRSSIRTARKVSFMISWMWMVCLPLIFSIAPGATARDEQSVVTDATVETLCDRLVSENGASAEFEALLQREEGKKEAESPDGRFVLAIEGGKILVTTDGATRELDAGEFGGCGSIGCRGGPESVRVSNDSRYAVTNQTVSGGSTIIWDTEDWKELTTASGRPRLDSAVRFVASHQNSMKHGDQVFLYDLEAREWTHVAGRAWSNAVCALNNTACPEKSGDFLEKIHGPVRSEGEYFDLQSLVFLPRSSILAILSRSNQLYLYNAVKRTSHACVMGGCDSEVPFSCDNKAAIISLMENNWGRRSPAQLLPLASERLRDDREVALVAMRHFVRSGCRGCCEYPPIHLLSANLQADPKILKAAIAGVKRGSCYKEELQLFWWVVYYNRAALTGTDDEAALFTQYPEARVCDMPDAELRAWMKEHGM